MANIQNLANLFIVINYSHLRLYFEFNSLNMTKKTKVSFNQRDPGNHFQILWSLWSNCVHQVGFVIAVFYQEN